MKFSVAIALSAIASSASAFAPGSSKSAFRQQPRSSSAPLRMSDMPESPGWKGYYTNYDDSQVVKTGADVGFDPLGFSDTNAGLFFMREAEIKHCRLAM